MRFPFRCALHTWARPAPPQKELVIGGGFRDGEKAVTVTRGQCRVVQALTSNHEEADTRMILHANHAARADRRLVIQLSDTDVLVLSISHFRSLACPELWFRTGVKNRHRFIPVHDIAHALGEKMCSSLPGFHAIQVVIRPALLLVSGRKRRGIYFVVVLTTKIVCPFSERSKS